MKAAIIGYGRMGREIAGILLEKGHEVVLVVDENNAPGFSVEELKGSGAEVAIEFSTPGSAFENVRVCLEAGVPVVCGTTGWSEHLPQAERLCRENGGAFFYASNYSIGVNVMFRLNEVLARIMDTLADYDVTVEETHHTGKKDAPSGTAITLAETIVREIARKKSWSAATTTEPSELEVTSVRRSVVPGTHIVTYESAEDAITVSHAAKGRVGFAKGAVAAAEFIRGKNGIFNMDDLLAVLIGSNGITL